MRENFVRIAACIAALLLVTHFSTAETPPTYTTAEAASHTGEIAIVCGKVFDTHHSGPGNSFINLDGAYPNQAFTVFIPGQKAPDAIDIRSFEGKNICVTGRIALYKGKPQIVVHAPTQIEER